MPPITRQPDRVSLAELKAELRLGAAIIASLAATATDVPYLLEAS